MKPENAPIRMREWIPFTTFALVDKKPEKIKVREHLFPYEGAKADNSLIWGLYGTVSINGGMFLAEDYARQHKRTLLTINMWYHVPDYDQVRNHIDEETAKRVGYLHLGRVTAEFRAILHEEGMQWAKKHIDASGRILLPSLSFEDFVRRYPAFVRHLLREGSGYNLVVHPVQQSYDIKDQTKLWVATGRNDHQFIKNAEVRFMSDIEVIV